MSNTGASYVTTLAVPAPSRPYAPDQRRRVCGYPVHRAAAIRMEAWT